MNKYITTIQLNTGKIVTEETEEKTKEDCKEYWENYIQYWGKVHSNWSRAKVLNIDEIVK
jgi:hypothetical protein